MLERPGSCVGHRVVVSTEVNWEEGGSLLGALTKEEEAEESGGRNGGGGGPFVSPGCSGRIVTEEANVVEGKVGDCELEDEPAQDHSCEFQVHDGDFVFSEFFLDVKWPLKLPCDVWKGWEARTDYSPATKAAGISAAWEVGKLWDQKFDGGGVFGKIVDEGAPVSKGCFQGFREDDEFGGALHGVVDWREEPFSSWDSKGGVLYFSCNFLKIIEGNCPFFENGTDLFDNFLTSFGC